MQPQAPQSDQPGPRNCRPPLHISHRRTPSELTPFMMEQYNLQAQIQALQTQQQILEQQQQYGAMPPPPFYANQQGMQYMQQQQQQGDINRSTSGPHRRNFSVQDAPAQGLPSYDQSMHGRRAGGGFNHARRHSLALTEAKRAAAQRQGQQTSQPSVQQSPLLSGQAQPQNQPFQFPTTNQPADSISHGPPSASMNRRYGVHGRSQSLATSNETRSSNFSQQQRGSQISFLPVPQSNGTNEGVGGMNRQPSAGHSRQSSRNFDGNWRQAAAMQPAYDQIQPSFFAPGHRSRASMGSMGQFSFPPQLNMAPGGMIPNSMLSPQLMQQQQLQNMNNQNGQQRKSLFAPYLPQNTLPQLINEGKLVAGFLRVNKKNRSDAYVSTDVLESDIFICGSKDRNRALEGDLVAVELLDVDEVWNSKREKEEKKKRKDGSDTNGAGLRRQGSIRNRPEPKRKDDVEVEGQSLFLSEEDEVNDEQKPMYAGHIVAVMERAGGQLFSGNLGLLRPSSAATKEKQEAERREREGERSLRPLERTNDKPKIVWFKPTDKRVPLIAIPTEQAPKDFVENHQAYANKIFVACIKRWPITSLHPFGTLTEELGDMGDLEVETEALLRDNNFSNEPFSETLTRLVDQEVKIEESEDRRDFTAEKVFSIDPLSTKDLDNAVHLTAREDGVIEVGVHIADVAHYVKYNSPVDREAKKRGAGVYLVQRSVPMLPSHLSEKVASLVPGEERRSVSLLFESKDDDLICTWIGKAKIKSIAALTYDDVQAFFDGKSVDVRGLEKQLSLLNIVTEKLRNRRFNASSLSLGSLRLMFALDDDRPVETNVFESKPAYRLIEELMLKANMTVARRIYEAFPDRALLRRHPAPIQRRLAAFAEKAKRLGFNISVQDGGSLQRGLLSIEDPDVRKAMETFVIKAMHRAKYCLSTVHNDDSYFHHYALNVSIYTHFTSPIRRYADIAVHRQLEAALNGTGGEIHHEEADGLAKTIEQLNNRTDCAHNAQEQSIHLFLCTMINNLTIQHGPVLRNSIVISVDPSSFDVLIPEFGVEKRVHLDQLPLVRAEWDDSRKILELHWQKGVDTATYVPEDEKQAVSRVRSSSLINVEDEIQRKMMDIGSLTIEDETALFDGDEDSAIPEESQSEASTIHPDPSSKSPLVKLSTRATNLTDIFFKDTQRRTRGNSIPPKPTDFMFNDTEERSDGTCVQYIRELSRVPVVVQADITNKSPPCLLIKAVNPWHPR
ncbi:Virulence protein SSD1 [Neolecta irregularis DAH-3]|uniref:Virulence protein SSD1 n=1 Tax=Neolecta irregularis (strain DAH-3) TaxID=1198029 RepID=A0A1U7LGM5_NEOID|nr:Virulence protein SSD1 [Neolecta irregularis DAH-3]|eukprot:OLL21810.1 Virulence protein SSD1 [Neolecta irregularis DAH-3]